MGEQCSGGRDTAAPEYEAWEAKRAKDAAAIKLKGQPDDGSGLSAGKAQLGGLRLAESLARSARKRNRQRLVRGGRGDDDEPAGYAGAGTRSGDGRDDHRFGRLLAAACQSIGTDEVIFCSSATALSRYSIVF
jgi:hypothetical protein